jgi:DNA replication complex GINS protein SLD5 C-terminus
VLLKDYATAVERHLAATVTDHFPQEVWRSLEIPSDMADEPNLNQFVFIRCKSDVVIYENGSAQPQPSGVCRVVRYERIRQLLLEGKVELM